MAGSRESRDRLASEPAISSIEETHGDSCGEGWRKKAGIGGGRLARGVRGKRFQLQIVDPCRPGDFVIKFHGRLTDYVDAEKPDVEPRRTPPRRDGHA